MAGHPESKRANPELDQEEQVDYPQTESEVKEALQRAREYREEGDYESGIGLLIDALRADRLKDRIYYRLGNIYFDAGKLKKAEHCYQQAVEHNEEHVNAQHNLAVVYHRRGKIGKAVRQRKKAQKLEVNKPPTDELSEDQRATLKRVSWKVLRYLILAVVLCGGGVYLALRFI